MLYNIIVFLAGVVAGGGLNLLSECLPQEDLALADFFYCKACRHPLAWAKAVSAIVYLVFRGKCHSCGARAPLRYLLVELGTGAVFVCCLQKFGCSLTLVGALLFSAVLVLIAVIDYDHRLIFDNVLLVLAGSGLVIHLLTGRLSLPDMLIASVAGGVFILVVAILGRVVLGQEVMGFGDIKFAAALGFWFEWQLSLFMLMLSFVFSGIGGGAAVVLGLKSRKDFIPFGPFIALAAFLSYLYGYEMLNWYFYHP